MKKSYRLAPVGMMLGAVFVIVSIFLALNPRAVGTTGPMMVFVVGWTGFLGVAIVYMSFVRRIELTDEGITKFNSLGKIDRQFAWSELAELSFDRAVKTRNSDYGQYALKSKSGEIMTIPDNFGGWDDVRDTINRRIQNPTDSGEQLVTSSTIAPGSSQARARKSGLAAGIFIAVWLILFFLFGSLSGTTWKYKVDLYEREKVWDVEYTFSNTSKFNSLTFDIERTWLNQTEAQDVPQGIRVEHGQSAVTHVLFPKSAAETGKPAHLHSWWQYHSGSKYHMQVMDHDLTADKDDATNVKANTPPPKS